MKKLGLIGGTGPESTIIYYSEITSKVQKDCGNFPELTIESMSVFDVLRFCEERDYDGLAQYLLSGLTSLRGAGCDIAAFTGITPHIVYDTVHKTSPLPVISMVDTSLDYAARRKYRKLALLGTLPTMEGGFFKEPFSRQGIEICVPQQEERQFIHSRISNELEFGRVTGDTVAGLGRIAERMISQEHAEAVILGCTELPLAFEKIDLPVEKMDVMKIHIERLCGLIEDKGPKL